jgi:hypothetical protein
MTEQQYAMAETDLVLRLQTMRETESGAQVLIPKAPSSAVALVDTLDNEYDQPILSEQSRCNRVAPVPMDCEVLQVLSKEVEEGRDGGVWRHPIWCCARARG